LKAVWKLAQGVGDIAQYLLPQPVIDYGFLWSVLVTGFIYANKQRGGVP